MKRRIIKLGLNSIQRRKNFLWYFWIVLFVRCLFSFFFLIWICVFSLQGIWMVIHSFIWCRAGRIDQAERCVEFKFLPLAEELISILPGNPSWPMPNWVLTACQEPDCCSGHWITLKGIGESLKELNRVASRGEIKRMICFGCFLL